MTKSIGGEAPRRSVAYFPENNIKANELWLSDISQKDKPWDKHRGNADNLENYYRTEEFDRYAERMSYCAQLLEFGQVLEDSEYKLKLRGARFCRVRYCPVCQWRRSLMWKAKGIKILPGVMETYPKYRWLFLTLTVRNCKITELRETLQWMNKSWERISQRKKFPAVGWIRSTEVTRGKDGSAHPHFHCLMLVKPSYFTRDYIKHEKWVELWQSCLRVDYSPSVDIRPIRAENSPVEILPEILKYTVKEDDLLADREWSLELTRQMYKVRTVATGGVLKQYLRKSLEEEPEDLIGRNEDKTEDKLGEGGVYFTWKGDVKRYKFLETEI